MADDTYRLGRAGAGPRTAPVPSPNTLAPSGQVKPYRMAGGFTDARGTGSIPVRQPSVAPPGYSPGSMRLPGGYGVQPAGTPAAPPTPFQAATAAGGGGYELGRSPTPQRLADFAKGRPMAGSGFRPPAPAPAAGPSASQAIASRAFQNGLRSRTVAPQVAGLSSRLAPAAASAPGVTGPQAWNALMQQGPPTPQQAYQALHPQMGASSAPAAAGPAGPAAPAAAGTAAAAGRASLGSRLGAIGSRIGGLGRGLARAGPGMALGYALGFASDPENNFRALTGAPPVPREPDAFNDAANKFPILGPMVSGAHNTLTEYKDLFTDPAKFGRDFHNGLRRIGSVIGGHGDPAIPPRQPEATEPDGIRVPSGFGEIAEHGSADQLNGLYEHLGIGGRNPASPADPSPAAAPAMGARSGDSADVLSPSRAGPAPEAADHQMWGPHGWETYDPVLSRLQGSLDQASLYGSPEGGAALGHAIANYRGATQHQDAQMMSSRAQMVAAQADMERATNPLGGYMNPVGLSVLDGQLGGTGNIIGSAQAHGIGLGPGGAINPQGMAAYAGIRHPEFSGMVGSRDWNLDQARALYAQARGRFAAGDAQLNELQGFVRQLLAQRYTPDELDAETQPGLGSRIMAPFFGRDNGANANLDWLHELGVR